MAAESKLIPTITETAVVGSSISITSFYQEDDLPDTLDGMIADSVGIQDGVSYIEAELLIKMKNSPEHLSYSLNDNGDLILTINTGDEDNYSINSNGDLIYTTEE